MELAGREWSAVVVLGAFLALDHAAWPSLLCAQPLIGGLVAGWLCGHPMAGVAAGGVVQLVWMVVQPLGGIAVPEGWLAGFAAALCVPFDVSLAGSGWLDDPRLAAPAVVGILAAALGRWLLLVQRALIERLGGAITAALAAGDARPAVRLHVLGLGLHALRGATMALVVLAMAPAASRALGAAGVAAPAGRIALALGAAALAGCAPRSHRGLRIGLGLAAGALVALAV
jgi:mannose/fructose/N-acetylgalactosamine-specific phosphotransferase system component IIC